MIGINALMLAAVPFLFSLFAVDPALEKAARGRMLTYFTFILSFGALTSCPLPTRRSQFWHRVPRRGEGGRPSAHSAWWRTDQPRY